MNEILVRVSIIEFLLFTLYSRSCVHGNIEYLVPKRYFEVSSNKTIFHVVTLFTPFEKARSNQSNKVPICLQLVHCSLPKAFTYT